MARVTCMLDCRSRVERIHEDPDIVDDASDVEINVSSSHIRPLSTFETNGKIIGGIVHAYQTILQIYYTGLPVDLIGSEILPPSIPLITRRMAPRSRETLASIYNGLTPNPTQPSLPVCLQSS